MNDNEASIDSDAQAPTRRTIYVLVRSDLSPTQQMVQAVHAAAETGRRYYRPHHGIASLVVLAVADRQALLAARHAVSLAGIATEMFFEPDDGVGESAIATEPINDRQRRHMRPYRLWRPINHVASELLANPPTTLLHQASESAPPSVCGRDAHLSSISLAN